MPPDHERTPEHAPGLPDSFERGQPGAEEILLELQADRQRAQKSPTTITPAAHREPPTTSDTARSPRVPRDAATERSRDGLRRSPARPSPSPRWCPFLRRPTRNAQPARDSTRTLCAATTTPAADANPSADLRILAAANARARAKDKTHADALRARSRSRRDAHPRVHRVSVRPPRTTNPVNAQPAATTTTSTPASSEQSTTQPAASTASAPSGSTQQPANSTPPASQPAASQPAGPTGFGRVVGNNCNPQCH